MRAAIAVYRAHRRAFAHQRYAGATQTHNYEFNDPLTNNVQEGPNIRDFLNMMGNKAGRVAFVDVTRRGNVQESPVAEPRTNRR